MDFNYPTPSGKGDRSIISHIGSSTTGLLDGALLMHRGAKANKSSDCHTEMNHRFMDWLEKKIFPKLQSIGRCVLVIDRAKYHLVLTEETRPVTSAWKKGDIAKWIKERGIGVPADWPLEWEKEKTKVQLYALACAHKPKPRFLVQDLADNFGVKILILPTGHPELNPIEMVWALIRRNCSDKSLNCKLTEVEEIARDEMSKMTAEKFSRYEEDVKKIEVDYWKFFEAE